MLNPVTFAVLILATATVTRVFAQERITLPLRAMVLNGFTVRLRPTRYVLTWDGSGESGKLTYLVHCVYCAAFWAAALVAAVFTLWPDHPVTRAALIALACAEAAPRLITLADRAAGGR